MSDGHRSICKELKATTLSILTFEHLLGSLCEWSLPYVISSLKQLQESCQFTHSLLYLSTTCSLKAPFNNSFQKATGTTKDSMLPERPFTGEPFSFVGYKVRTLHLYPKVFFEEKYEKEEDVCYSYSLPYNQKIKKVY